MTSFRLLHGDCREVLRSLPEASVQCCVTSPPYWGLRDYGTATWIGGDPSCEHRVGGQVADSKAPGAITTGQRPGVDASRCRYCGAERHDMQIGLESTPDAYVAELVAVFREVRRVLADDGVLWLNLGDSYATSGGAVGRAPDGGDQGERFIRAGMINTQPNRMKLDGFKPKDLVGIPWRVAVSIDAYLGKQGGGKQRPYQGQDTKDYAAAGAQSPSDSKRRIVDSIANGTGRNRRSVWTVPTQPYSGAHFAVMPEALAEPCILAGSRPGDIILDPFNGAGTTGVVATRHGRSYVGIDANAAYLEIARDRIAAVAPLFVEEAVS